MTDEKKRVLVLAIGPAAPLVHLLHRIEHAGIDPIVLRAGDNIEAEVMVVPYPFLPMPPPEPPIVEDFKLPRLELPPPAPIDESVRRPRGPNLSKREQRRRQMEHGRKR